MKHEKRHVTIFSSILIFQHPLSASSLGKMRASASESIHSGIWDRGYESLIVILFGF